ncbi:cytochrome P450 [Zopfia rhizophila CBS 207.26]|uniref:Cytochrome P450 n=1 Tax=Zopfia rhizophila CBS 207.26 TaxID=1314779 RepID=A0A6A6DYU9_9PEZI|nr:cytochrome P450 [Zopfia rhizophila CBS 207.26]
MGNLVLGTVACIFTATVCLKLSTWRKNYKAAEKAGFRTFYSPVYYADLWWLVLHTFLVPYLELLPKSWKQPWLPLAQLWRIWHVGHKPFEEVGSDTIILAAPNGKVLWTCDPSVVKQLYSSPTAQNPVKTLKPFLDVWGPIISTVEGEEWKVHRRIISYGLNPSTYATVWKEAIHQTNGLIDCWIRNGSVIPVVQYWTSRIILYILSSVLFNRRLDWKEQPENSRFPSRGYQVDFETALFTVVARFGLIAVLPRVLLKLPIKGFREAHDALTALTEYMQDMRSRTIDRIDEVASKPTKSLLESIVFAGTPGPHQNEARTLSEESVLGNLFLTLMAGHDTVANTLAFTLLLLTIYPEYQKEIQMELDHRLGDRPQGQCSIEREYPILQKGFLGAVLKESMRVYSVIEFGIKVTVERTVVNDSKGEQHTIPKDTTCFINFPAAFQNHSVWPQREISPERRAELHNSHAIDFDPGRWLGDLAQVNTDSYFPFAMGSRNCPGKPFAEIELVAILATLLKTYSIELVVDEDTLRNANGDQKLAWENARDEAFRKLEDNVMVNFNVHMTKELPIRITRRD